MTHVLPKKRFKGSKVRGVLPYLALSIGLVLATAPTWWMMVFGVELQIDALLKMRCAAWFNL